MKNLLILLAISIGCPLFAQSDRPNQSPPSQQKFSLELMAGANMNNMPVRPTLYDGDEDFNDRLRADFTFFAGITGRQFLSNRFAVKMDVQYLEKGFAINQPAVSSFERYRATYVDFVPQVEYKAYKNLFVSLGGYGGLRLDERVKYADQDWSGINPIFGPLAEDADWGLTSGVRMVFGRLSALVKYQHGLTPAIYLEATDVTGGTSKHHQFHRSLQLGLSFRVL